MSSKIARTILLVFILVLLAIDVQFLLGQPAGATITFNETDTIAPVAASAITTAGGSFTTLVLNVTQQNPRWKAYVGNVTGSLVLADSNQQSIYDWSLSVITGEVYASRNDNVSWGGIQCLTDTVLAAEETFLNLTTGAVDSINKTFNNTVHKSFWIGSTQIAASDCRAIATYLNDTAQASAEDALFQEILLDDGTNLVYATIMEQDLIGYHENRTFDFQMIIAEDEFAATPTTYYFYAEIG